MELTTHLTFTGQCEAAFRFYEKCLGATITFMMPWEGSPMADQAPPEWGQKLLHATLTVGSVHLSGADIPGGQVVPQGFALTVSTSDPAEAESMFAALAEGGKVTQPLEETFWAKRFGGLTDRFGVPWFVNCEKPM